MSISRLDLIKNLIRRKSLKDFLLDMMDNFWHKDDTLPGGGGGSLDVTLPAGTVSWAGTGGTLIEKIWIVGDEELGGFAVGTDVDSDDVVSFRDISSDPVDRIITIDLILNSDTILYFSGITSLTVLKLYNR